MAVKLGDALLYLGADDDKLKKDLNHAQEKTKGWGATMTGVLQGIGQGIAGAVIGTIKGAMDTVGESINLASDLAETTSKVNTLFGDQSEWIMKWADTAASAMGMTKAAALDAIGGMGNMFLQMGIGQETAGDMAASMTELAADIGSFHNADATDVIESMTAAFRGEYDSLQKYVPLINAAAVEQRALANTGKAAASELTALEKTTATYQLVAEGAGEATGDFARTSDGFSNSMKTLNAYWTEFKTLLGEVLLPMLTPFIAKIKEAAVTVLPALADYIHQNVIPAIEEWAANFDDWWADHGQPFIDDVKQAWEDIQTEAAASMGVTREEFKLNLEGLEAVADVLGKRIGTALGTAIGESVQEWWDNAFAVWWQDKIDRITSGNYFLGPGGLGDLNDLLGPQPPMAPIGPSLGPNQNGAGTSSGSGVNPYAVTINNYVDASSRSVGEAARDGTLDGLRQAGMR